MFWRSARRYSTRGFVGLRNAGHRLLNPLPRLLLGADELCDALALANDFAQDREIALVDVLGRRRVDQPDHGQTYSFERLDQVGRLSPLHDHVRTQGQNALEIRRKHPTPRHIGVDRQSLREDTPQEALLDGLTRRGVHADDPTRAAVKRHDDRRHRDRNGDDPLGRFR